MAFDPERAAIRFGTGLSPVIAPPQSVSAMMSRLDGPDEAAEAFPIERYEVFAERIEEMVRLLAERREKRRSPEGDGAVKEKIRKLKKETNRARLVWLYMHLLRRTHTEDGLRERLAFFWGDHFIARGKVNLMRRVTSPYIESAIRPNVAGYFADMLKAVVQQPAMLAFLDQRHSIGPQSKAAQGRKRAQGVNENLAREVLELHTLGVTSAYTQADVAELSELFTGLTYGKDGRFSFEPDFAEPGAETVLGQSYGGDPAQLSHIFEVLDDLALRPETARHLAGKMARHFVSDRPSEGLVKAMTARYLESGGHLGEMTRTMLEHDDAWQERGGNVKLPVDFVGSAMRALNVHPRTFSAKKPHLIRRVFFDPMALMGQRYQEPLGPDGWPQEDEAWITPQRLAARFDWAMSAPRRLVKPVPDPREVLQAALGGQAPEQVKFAARSAENRWTGIGLVLASAAFQRM